MIQSTLFETFDQCLTPDIPMVKIIGWGYLDIVWWGFAI